MTRYLPLPLLAALAFGCAKEGDVGTMGENPDVSYDFEGDPAQDDGVVSFDLDEDDPGTTDIDFTPDITPGVEVDPTPDIDLDDDNDGVVEIDATPDIDLDDDNDGVVEIDATPDLDLTADAETQRGWLDAAGELEPAYRHDDVLHNRYVWLSTGGFALDPDMSPSACPSELQGTDVEVRETWRGFAVQFTTDDSSQVEELRHLAANLARQYSYERDLRPLLIDEGTVEVDGSDLPSALDRSYATLELVPGGVEIMVEPRDNSEINAVRDLGYGFIDELEETCGIV